MISAILEFSNKIGEHIDTKPWVKFADCPSEIHFAEDPRDGCSVDILQDCISFSFENEALSLVSIYRGGALSAVSADFELMAEPRLIFSLLSGYFGEPIRSGEASDGMLGPQPAWLNYDLGDGKQINVVYAETVQAFHINKLMSGLS